jgi:hypothetical protein
LSIDSAFPCESLDVDPQIFFSRRGKDITEAKALCFRCPIMMDCRDFARDFRLWGTWGGETQEERKAAGYTPNNSPVLTKHPPRKRARPGEPAPCGTKIAHGRHKRANEPVCEKCKEWKRQYDLETGRTKSTRGPKDQIKPTCPSHSAYVGHKKRKEILVPLAQGGCGCLEAEAAYSAARRAAKREQKNNPVKEVA